MSHTATAFLLTTALTPMVIGMETINCTKTFFGCGGEGDFEGNEKVLMAMVAFEVLDKVFMLRGNNKVQKYHSNYSVGTFERIEKLEKLETTAYTLHECGNYFAIKELESRSARESSVV